MSDWETAEQDFIASLSRRPAARAPATIGEIWSSEFTRSGLDTVSGVGTPLRQALDDFSGAIERHAGKSLEDYATEKGVQLGAVTPGEYAKRLGQLADTFDAPTQEALKPLRDVRLNAAKKAQAIEREAGETAAATYGLSGHATAFLAGVARQTLDPVNLTAMAVTAPLGGTGGFFARVGTEALVNAGSQALVEPYVQGQRGELGLDAGIGKAAQNVVEAGIGGAVFSGLLHGAARGLEYLGRREPIGSPPIAVEPARPPAKATAELSAVDSEIVAAGRSGDRLAEDVAYIPDYARNVTPEDMTAAARLAERDEVIAGLSDAKEADGVVAHTAAVDNAARAMEEGRPIDGAEPLVPPPLVVARRMGDGSVRYGEPGQIHADMIDPAELTADPYFPPAVEDMGFAEAKGSPYLTRSEATAWLAENRPAISRQIDGIRMGAERQIEAGQLNAAVRAEAAVAEPQRIADAPLPASLKAEPPKEVPPAPKVEGDAAVAARAAAVHEDAVRALDDVGDFDLVLVDADGSTRTVKASEALAGVQDDVTAHAELDKCIAGGAQEAAE